MFIAHTKVEETAVQIFDEGYSINVSCPLNLICGFFYQMKKLFSPEIKKPNYDFNIV
jgi:hypothetical protein